MVSSQHGARPATGIESHRNGSRLPLSENNCTPNAKPGVGLEGCPYANQQPTKNGSDLATSAPLFISTALFDLPVSYPLTLLLIAGQFSI